jgi:hypothetical protein
MKYKNINVIAFLLVLVSCLVFASCKEKFESVNTPTDRLSVNTIGQGQLGQAFAKAEFVGTMSPDFEGGNWTIAGVYSQYYATTTSDINTDLNIDKSDWTDGAYNTWYGDGLPQLHFVLQYTKKHNLDVAHAIADVEKVAYYERITNYWGPIVYSNFGNGETSVPFDSQKDVYMSFFKTLNNAIDILNSNQGKTVAAFGASDLIYSGDVTKWLKYANSLKLRLALRISYVEPTKAQQFAESAVDYSNGGVILNNDENADVLTTNSNKNGYSRVTNWGEFRMSANMESLLVGYKDPRLPFDFSPAKDGDSDGNGSPYEGLRNGIPKSEITPSLSDQFSDLAPQYLNSQRGGQNPDLVQMHASEVYFLMAEGALNGWDMNGGTAEQYYNKGISASLKLTANASNAVINSYIHNTTDRPIAPGGKYGLPPISNLPIAFMKSASKEKKLEQIITQKYIALFPDTWQAWATVRRTGYPRMYTRVSSDNPNVGRKEMVRRMPFTLTSYSNNKEATEAAVDLLNGKDIMSTPLWWDVKTNKPPFVGN